MLQGLSLGSSNGFFGLDIREGAVIAIPLLIYKVPIGPLDIPASYLPQLYSFQYINFKKVLAWIVAIGVTHSKFCVAHGREADKVKSSDRIVKEQIVHLRCFKENFDHTISVTAAIPISEAYYNQRCSLRSHFDGSHPHVAEDLG